MKTLKRINRITRLIPGLFAAGTLLFSLCSYSVSADNIITSGTTLKVTAGTSLVSSDNLVIKSGGILDNAGTVILKKNLTNQNVAANSLGTGTVELSGTVAQTISGNNNIQNLTVNNAAGVVNGGETRVNGTLNLTSGLVTLGTNHFLLGTSATIGGAPSATAMLVPTGTGEVRKYFSTTGSFTIPIGDNTVTNEYSPVTLNFTTGTFAANAYVGINLVDAMYPGSPGGSYISRYWNVNSSGITSFTCNPMFQYVAADVVGTESSIYCVRITPSSVNYFNAANTVLDQLSATAINQFGTFTGYQTLANKTLNITCLLEGLYNGGGTMRKAQNAIGDQFTGTTADQVNVELHNTAAYSSLAYTLSNVNLSTSGALTGTIPGIISGSYYVTITHRNSIETTTAAPISFAGAAITYNFTNAANKAYADNMRLMSGGYYAFYAGDVNQDDIVDSSDMIPIENLSNLFATGYIPEDANGDGLIDSSDMIIVENNASLFVSTQTP
jgi:hypothetical protein